MTPIIEPKEPIAIATFLSLSLYMGILFCIFFYLGHSQEFIQRFTSKKDDFLDVTLVQRKVEPTPTQEKKRIIKKTEEPKRVVEPTPAKESAPKPAAKQSADLQNLFKSIDTSKLADPAPISVAKAKTQSRLKPTKKPAAQVIPKEDAKNLTAALELETKSVQWEKSAADATYDPFRGKINDILQENWDQTIDTVSGAEAKVTVFVDYRGTFSYTIVSMSYNDAFNAKLRDFLEAMREENFPPYTEGESLSMTIKFKDVLER